MFPLQYLIKFITDLLKELKTKENFEMYTNALNENARTQVNQILAMS